MSFGLFCYAPWETPMKPPEGHPGTLEDVLSDDFGGLIRGRPDAPPRQRKDRETCDPRPFEVCSR